MRKQDAFATAARMAAYTMDFLSENLITILILLPVVGTVAIIAHQLFWNEETQLKWVALIFTLLDFLISLGLLANVPQSPSGFYFEKNVPWISAINTNYHVGIDGLSVWLVLLTTFIMPIAVL